jgi:hypothetical protein
LTTQAAPETERGTGELGEDPVVRLAEQVLIAHGRRDPGTLLQTTLTVAAQQAANTEREVEARLKALGVDWRPPADRSGARLSLAEPALTFWREGGGWRAVQGPIAPGTRVRLKLAVSNSGNAAASRVLALLRGESESGTAFDIPMGWIDPGQTLEREQEWDLPARMPGPLGVFRIDLVDSSGALMARRPVFVPVASPPLPRFEADIGMHEEGNGNGEWERGEVLRMTVRITNAGAGASAGARALLGWTPGAWEPLDPAALNVPPLSAAETWSTTLRFRAAATAAGDRGGGDPGGIVLRVRDLDHEQVRLEHGLELTRRVSGTPVVLKPPVIDWEAPAPRTTSAEFRLSGHLIDDRAARDLILRVNGRKVAYVAAPQPQTADLPFALTIPLDPGWNRVVVDGHDDQRLLTQRTFGVWREGE